MFDDAVRVGVVPPAGVSLFGEDGETEDKRPVLATPLPSMEVTHRLAVSHFSTVGISYGVTYDVKPRDLYPVTVAELGKFLLHPMTFLPYTWQRPS